VVGVVVGIGCASQSRTMEGDNGFDLIPRDLDFLINDDFNAKHSI
jgi:hypothetical protein